MNASILIYILIGAAIGAGLGYVNKCASGACALTANWRRGAIAGAVIGLVLSVASSPRTSSSELNQSTAHVKRVEADQFDAEVLQASTPVLVDFYAVWCGPCKMVAPVVDSLAAEFSGKIKVVKVNVDDAPAVAQRYGIQAIPTLMLFKNGEPVERLVGVQPESVLREKLRAVSGATEVTGVPGSNPGAP